MKKQNVLITGGAGFLGINLIRFLLKKGGYRITCLDIATFDYPDVKNQINILTGDIRAKKLIDKIMKGQDLVVHAAAALPLYKPANIFSTDIKGTQNLLKSAFDNQIKRFIHISSTAVYGIPNHHPIFEDDNLEGVGPYGIAKVEAERICLNYRQKGMCVPILRPKSFVGPERLGVFALFYDWAKDGRSFPLMGNGKNRYQLLDVDDLCQAIYLCLSLKTDQVNDTFNIGANKFGTMKQDYQAVLDLAGFGKKIKTFPAQPMIWALRLLEILHLSPLYKWVYETASKDSFVSISKAEKILGFKPKYSNQDALIRNYKWYLENIDQVQSGSGISHRVPWKQGILSLFKSFF